MNDPATDEISEDGVVSFQTIISFNWKDSPSVQKLLNTISSIIAADYVTTAKQNPNLFLKQETLK